jgi:uncharacterized spore protein YtfJ
MDVKTMITILAAISGIVLGWVGGTRAFKQEIARDAGSGAALRTDVEYIKHGVDDMRLEQRAQGQRFDVLSERVTRIEESAKQYHKRLDRIEENRRSEV